MKLNFSLVIFVLIFFLTYSCAPVYKCGDPRPIGNISGGNRLNDVVVERDALCDEVKAKDEIIEGLTEENEELLEINDSLITRNEELVEEYNALEKKYDALDEKHEALKLELIALQEKYSNLLSDNFQRGHMYDERLKEQERRMNLKEKELAERQKRIEELERIVAEQDSIAQRLNRLLREALLGFKSDELTIEIKNGKVYVSMSDKLMFKSGSANVESKGKEALQVLARVLKQNNEFEILVEGHTDNVPIKTSTYADNWDLSVARATSMVRILTDEYELEPTRLTASGKGEYAPRADNQTAEGRAKNRRTEIILSPKLDELMNMLNE